ncbi:acyl-CoA thioesterase II [Nakamurella flava]|uniref:Acyl-CoA thioesterase 2 n=1 Tax=Nakamurella flava TaxID=2576308 RepID=A0A4V6CS81_9ACTN|nr:acyl-CoA thioesterase II [Nakamurella flava]TKV60585.1 acyl-CoA thioesterase II [Nakamurella flava]
MSSDDGTQTAISTAPVLDTDGVPRGQPAVDGLVQLLNLERLDDNLFRGVSPEVSPTRVFGGQVAAQALVAAGRTVPSDRPVHSLHAYFLRPGSPERPIIYQVDRTRDGRSFTTRRVVALQHGKPIFTMSASFQVDEPGVDHALPAPLDVPPPEVLPGFAERIAPVREYLDVWGRVPRPLDIRYVDDPPWLARLSGPRPAAHSRVWFRTDGDLPDDDLLHVCLLAYMSDLTLLYSVQTTHGLAMGFDRMQVASLDHAMWFHRPFRADEWILYDTSSPSASGARGLGTGHFFSADGRLLATVVQEGLIRLR